MSNTVPQDDSLPSRLDHEDVHFSPGDAEASAVSARGEKVERIITTKDYLPGGDKQFPLRVGLEPPGTRMILGTLRGVVNSTERRTKLWEGKELESVWLNGEFEAVLKGTGEVKTAVTAILPKAFGMTIEATLASLTPEDRAELTIDCDIGLESTGRPISYEWIVIYYRDGKAMKAQRAMRDVRARSEARLAHEARKLISAPVNPA